MIGRVQLTADRPGHLAASVRASGPAILAFTERFHQGWSATAGGRPLEVVRVEYRLPRLPRRPRRRAGRAAIRAAQLPQRHDRLRDRRGAPRRRAPRVASMTRGAWDAFGIVRDLGLAWPDVKAETKYDGSPVLKCRGCFMAGVAMHASAEPDSLVVRVDPDARTWLLDEAADTYYVTRTTSRTRWCWCVSRASIATPCATCWRRRGGPRSRSRRGRAADPAASRGTPVSPSPAAPAARAAARAPRSAASHRARCR